MDLTNSTTSKADMQAELEPTIDPIAAGLSILFLSILSIAGNILLLCTYRNLRRANRKSLHSLHVTIGIFSGLELAFAAIPQLIIAAAFLSETWRLDTASILCNFTGWLAFTVKATCAFITSISMLERYVETCNQNAQESRFKKVVNSQLYWAVRSLVIAGLMATIPLFYGNGTGISSSESSGSYCHMNFQSDSTATFVYTIIMCLCGFALLQLVLFCTISILCQINNVYTDDAGSNPSQPTINKHYYSTPPASPTSPTSRDSMFSSPSKYALDSPTFFETMQNDPKREQFHLTRAIMIVAIWYWLCLLPYLIMMTLTLANYSISDVFDFSVTVIILINSALTPYLIIIFYPLYKKHLPNLSCCLSFKEKRLEPRPASPDHLPLSVSVAYNEMSPVSLYVRPNSSSAVPWQTNSSTNGNHTRNNHIELDVPETDTTVLVPNGRMVKKTQYESNKTTETDGPFYENKGYLPDDHRQSEDSGETIGQSDGASNFTEDGTGSSTESECSACDLDEEYTQVVVLNKHNQYYYPNRIPEYSYDPMGGAIYQQDPENPHILYAINPLPRKLEETMSAPPLPAGRILGRAELRKMTKKGRAPPTFYTRDDIPCETSLYSHNYRTPSFLKQYKGRAGWKELIEIERRGYRNAPASDGDRMSEKGLDDFDMERRNTWNGGVVFQSGQGDVIKSGNAVDRQVSYRLAVGDEDLINKIRYIDESPVKDNGLDPEDLPEPLVEKEVILKNVQVGDPLSMNMVFQKVIANKTESVSSSQRSNSSRCSTETVRRDDKFPIQMDVEIEHKSSSINDQQSETRQSKLNASDMHDDVFDTKQSIEKPGKVMPNESNEKSLPLQETHDTEDDNISVSSLVSDVSYRQYVRAIGNTDVPNITITPAIRKGSLAQSESDSIDSIHSVESLLHMFTSGLGKLTIPSYQQAKNVESKQKTISTPEASAENPADNEADAQNEFDFDFDDTSFVTDADIAFDDFLAEFDRKLKRKATLSSTESDDIDKTDSQEQEVEAHNRTTNVQTLSNNVSATNDLTQGENNVFADQSSINYLNALVEEIVEDHLNNALDSLSVLKPVSSSKISLSDENIDLNPIGGVTANVDTNVTSPVQSDEDAPVKLQQTSDKSSSLNVEDNDNMNYSNNNTHHDNDLSKQDLCTNQERAVNAPKLCEIDKPNVKIIKSSENCSTETSENGNQEFVKLETSNNLIDTDVTHLTVKLERIPTNDKENSNNTEDIVEEDHTKDIVKGDQSEKIKSATESDSDTDEANTSGFSDIPYVVRYNVPLHVLESTESQNSIQQGSDDAVKEAHDSMSKQNTHQPEVDDEVLQRSYRDNDIDEVLESSHNIEKSTSPQSIQPATYNNADTKSKDSSDNDKAPNWVREMFLFQTPAAPPNSPAVQDDIDNVVKSETPSILKDHDRESVSKDTNNTDQSKQGNINKENHTKDKQGNGNKKFYPRKPKIPPPTPPKPKWLKRRKKPNGNILQANKADEVKREEPKQNNEGLNGNIINSISKENSQSTQIKHPNDYKSSNTPEKQNNSELAVPGVAPRKRSPRSLWKQYRKDILALPSENKSQATKNPGVETNNLSPSNNSSNQVHKPSYDIVQPYQDRIPDPVIDISFHNNINNKINDSQANKSEGDIWDTIEQTTLPRTQPKSPLQDQLFQKLLENPSELKESIDQKSFTLHTNVSPSHQIPDGSSQHPDILGVKTPRSSNHLNKEDLVVLNANSFTCLNVPNKDFPNKDFPSPDGSPTNISVVDMVVIEVQDKTSKDHEELMHENSDGKTSTDSSFSSDDLSNISRVISAYSPDDTSKVSGSNLEQCPDDKCQNSPRSRRYSIETSLPNRNGYNLDMSVGSAGSEDLSVCSGNLSGTGTQMLDLVGRKRTMSLSTNVELQRNGSLLSNSELI